MSLASAQLGARAGWTARASSNPAVGLAARRSAVLAPGALGLRPPRESPNLHAPARSTALVVRAEAERKARFVRDENGKFVRTMEPPERRRAPRPWARPRPRSRRTRRRRIRGGRGGGSAARVRSAVAAAVEVPPAAVAVALHSSTSTTAVPPPDAAAVAGRRTRSQRRGGSREPGLAQQVEGPRQTSRQLQRRLRVRPGGASSRWQGGARRSAPR